ncbi:DUF6279 family lipoprotein [Vibrio sp. SCSIO 43136]|uniref:DUF6279 family lipoprotein n=1 Tax=Vibrio sp. SCSIO 43136 TaxID=2819101 RepID=UPI002075B5B1|nr:DUF6279 family lipoprotein [Vibrio sp. SCSIO 43136]USD66955.1 hypothetical protein J4N39_20135 [Vibrio sp. SCSIO 43136]
MQNIKRTVALLFIALFIAGCTTKFLYRNIDWLATTYIDDFVSLSSEQERMVELSIERLSEWHKVSELPEYIAHLEELKQVDYSVVDVDWVTNEQERMRLYSNKLVNKAAPSIYALITQLDDKQVAELLDNLQQKHQDYLEEHDDKSEQEIRQVYLEKMEEGLEKWVGSLTKEQKALMTDWSQQVMVTYQARISQNVRMHQEFSTLLAKRDNPNYFQLTLTKMLNQPESYYTQELDALIKHNRPLGRQLVADTLNSLTPKQRKHLIGELDSWQQIAKDLQ